MNELVQWEYGYATAAAAEMPLFILTLNEAGMDGWEVVSFDHEAAETDRHGRQVDTPLVTALVKRQIVPPPPPYDRSAGWYEDPTMRFSRRYWNGWRWTSHVSGDSAREVDRDPPTTLPPTEGIRVMAARR